MLKTNEEKHCTVTANKAYEMFLSKILHNVKMSKNVRFFYIRRNANIKKTKHLFISFSTGFSQSQKALSFVFSVLNLLLTHVTG